MHMTAVITAAEEGGFVSYNPETGTASQGDTLEEAIDDLAEAVGLYLEVFPTDKTVDYPLLDLLNDPVEG